MNVLPQQSIEASLALDMAASARGAASSAQRSVPIVEKSPVFAYNVDGTLATITYASGNSKAFVYNLDGTLNKITYTKGGLASVKTFAYNVDGSLASITQTP